MEGAKPGHLGLEFGAGQGHGSAYAEFESTAQQGHFQGGGALRIPHQQIADTERKRIGRAGRRDAQVRIAGPTEILHGGQEAR